MEQIKNNCLQELSRPNPIQKRVAVPPRSIMPLLPLPNFQHSQQVVDLAPIAKQKQEKQLFEVPTPQFSKLFKNSLYQSSSRFNLQSNNTNFACIKSFYSESGYHNEAQPQNSQAQIQFQSRFESGNLAFAARAEFDRQYYLLLQKDINSTRCTQWFFFRVHNKQVKGKLTFHILNFFKNYSSYQNGMKILFCSQSNDYRWSRGCEDIAYRKTNIKTGDKYHYALSFSFDFGQNNDITYFAHSMPYTFTMLDTLLLKISNSSDYRMICKRKTLTESPGGNYIDMLTITNFKSKKEKKNVFITSRVHPGQSPSSYVCEGIIKYLLSNSEDAKMLRQDFVFKIVPMLNPDGVINGSYRCSLSGYDLNRVWHCDNKISSPEIYYTKKAILEQDSCFLFIDLHAHSKKKGVFMYGCQNKHSPFLSRHIPYLLWKEVQYFNYYQCNFGMKLGREGTSRLTVHRGLNLPFSYTMEHSFCGPIKERVHFTTKNYRDIGKGICFTLKKYYTSANGKEEPEIFRQLYTNKELMQVGGGQDQDSSEDSDLDQPQQFAEQILPRAQPFRRKISSNNVTGKTTHLYMESTTKIPKRQLSRNSAYSHEGVKSFLSRNSAHKPKKFFNFMPDMFSMNFKKQEVILGEEVILSGRLSQTDKGVSTPVQKQAVISRPSSRYDFAEMDNLNNLFLPSITSANYKKQGRKKNYPKNFIQVGRQYLQAQGYLKEEIRSASQKKPQGWKDQVNSYL